MTEDLAEGFRLLVSGGLREGAILLLVDGLDEITNESDRVSFVHQLRTFLAIYPNVGLVVTSREAGFRVIGGALSTQCEHYKICDLNAEDIARLTLKWNKEVLGDSARIRSESKLLSDSICANDRLMKLAANPLLLTTLLLVKRWVGGPLPTKRSILYGKAIEVLLMTWNVEGHEPLDLEEVLPQLEYLAFSMMKDGEQAISSRKLQDILSAARQQMPEVLGWAKISISEFIQRVELRSSLLMMSGHVIQDGTVYPTYEFRHLTFQEYLVATAIVRGHYPGRIDSNDVLSVLEPYLADDAWEEIVPIVAVLGGRQALPLLKRLVIECKASLATQTSHELGSGPREDASAPGLLVACLLDEVQAGPDLLNEAIACVVHAHGVQSDLETILSTKYGDMLVGTAANEFGRARTELMHIGGNFVSMSKPKIKIDFSPRPTSNVSTKVKKLLADEDPLQASLGCLCAMEIAFMSSDRGRVGIARPERRGKPLTKKEIQVLRGWSGLIRRFFGSDKLYLQCSAIWAQVWISHAVRLGPSEVAALLPELVRLWRHSDSSEIQYLAEWLIATMSLAQTGALSFGEEIPVLEAFIKDKIKNPTKRYESCAALTLAYYLETPWTREELLQVAKAKEKDPGPDSSSRAYIRVLVKSLERQVGIERRERV
jgi:hypothetical protein